PQIEHTALSAVVTIWAKKSHKKTAKMLNKFFKADINCHVIKLLYMQTYVYINLKKEEKLRWKLFN
ncbi:MAG: hypothetical protein K2J54_01015, partial [Clostridia bacterium]|nr:hypothetical protein [Clostridia bacterium]